MFAVIKIHHHLLSTTLYVPKFIQIQSKNMHFIFAKIQKITITRGFSMKIIKHKGYATCFLTTPHGIYKNQANRKEKEKRERVN